MKKRFGKNFTNNDTSELCCGGRFHCSGEGHTRIMPQALILTLTECKPTPPGAVWVWTGRCPHLHTGAAPRAEEARSPCSCSEGSPSPAVSPVLPSASWEAPVEVQGVLKGVSLQGTFSQRGVEPHMSPPGSQPPGLAQSSAWTSHLLGESQNPFAWRLAQPAEAWSRAPSLCPPRV